MMCNNKLDSKSSMPDDKTMNNTPTQNTTSPNLTAARHPQGVDPLTLAYYVRYRRRQLGLSVPEAAALAGMELSQWYALEQGWIPSERDSRLNAIAETLEVGWIQISFAAALVRLSTELDVA
jgi:hypothetical protein